MKRWYREYIKIMMTTKHIPVLLNETIEALRIDPMGIYVDATGGNGGHSKFILEKLGTAGRLVTADCDESAIEILKKKSKMNLGAQLFTPDFQSSLTI